PSKTSAPHADQQDAIEDVIRPRTRGNFRYPAPAASSPAYDAIPPVPPLDDTPNDDGLVPPTLQAPIKTRYGVINRQTNNGSLANPVIAPRGPDDANRSWNAGSSSDSVVEPPLLPPPLP